MSRLDDLPIKRKVALVVLLTCTAALVLASLAFAAYEFYDTRHALVRDTTILAGVFGDNTRGALAFGDDAAAGETLAALKSEPHVVAARLYTKDGGPFADYARPDSHPELPAQPPKAGHFFERDHLMVFDSIVLDGKQIGTLGLQVDLHGIHDALVVLGGIAAVVITGSLLLALALSSRLQGTISNPILALAETARSVAERKDYTVRAPAQGRNETGLLTDAFNLMLAGIEERDGSLRKEVAERQVAEHRVQSQLVRLELLHRITRAISERQDLPSIFQVAIRTLEEDLPIDFVCVCLCEASANTLTVTSVGIRSEALAMDLALTKDARLEADANGLSGCVMDGRLIYEPDIRRSELPLLKKLAQGGLDALVAAPLLVESRVFGVLIAARRQTDSFSSGECEFVRQLSEHVALAAHQAQLYSALQQAYDDLRQTQQAVMQQERLRALGQMASGIAHDINNAISPVSLYTESLLENEPNLSTRTRDHLGTIQRAIDDVAQTVARMREFYRQRETQLTLSPVELNGLVRQVLDLSRARWSDMALQRGVVIKLATDLAADLPTVMGVESEIREALVNLIFNAVDAMPDGGTLTMRTRVKGADQTAAQAGRLVLVEVSDTGVGMSEDTRRRCLEPFFTTKGERGTGLGLAMVYGTARRHNADIEIDSVEGRGTTFRLGFPAPATIALASGATPAMPAVRSRLKILVVDDDPLLIKSLRDTLEIDGHKVVTATGGQMGIDSFCAAVGTAEPFALVITDLGMPYVDGRRVARAIKEASSSTPVILLTGWGQRLVSEGDVPPHVDRVLNKPPKLRELREALVQCVP